jgi:hypothetical protein
LTGGQLSINKDLTLQGPGANVITISGNYTNRIFNITNSNVNIYGLTIANGRVTGTNALFVYGNSGTAGETAYGGGVLRVDSVPGYTVTLADCLFLGNSAIGGTGSGGFPTGVGGSGGDADGGAIMNNAMLIMRNCCLAGNYVSGVDGGSGDFGAGTGGMGTGAGIWNNGMLILTNCTLSANHATGGNGQMVGGNVIAPGNGGNAEGGAIYDDGESAAVSCTISSNTVIGGMGGAASPGGHAGYNGGAYGGGICTFSGNFITENTIIAVNAGRSATDVWGAFTSWGFNLVGATNASTGLGINTDQVGNLNNVINPMLGALQDNGGSTPTMALLPSSPAVDQGNSFGSAVDQRGAPRSMRCSSNPTPGDGSDVGAFEWIPPSINMSQPNKKIVVSWSIYNIGFALQSATNLSANNWVSISNVPAILGNQRCFTNTLPGGTRFFRLH